jgi:hypothetical protein
MYCQQTGKIKNVSTRLTITVSAKVFTALIERATREGRSSSNLAAFLIECGLFPPTSPN